MLQEATFGGGCFWCTEAIFKRVKGVEKVISGYSGGNSPDPSYEEVSRGDSGHAEIIKITFDPQIITYKELLEIFFTTHDPTTLNRQGADEGTQYRSVIFFHNEAQKTEAETLINDLNETIFEGKVVTAIEPLTEFYSAEKYHQDYYDQNRTKPYCMVVIDPKIRKLKEKHQTMLKNGVE